MKPSNYALNKIRKQFPQVERVRDSRRTIEVSVKPNDTTSGRKKDPASCALARACVRTHIADAAIIGIGFSWLIKGKAATRYKTSVAISREITSFDRHQDFAEGGHYKLSKVPPSNRLNRPEPWRSGHHSKVKKGPAKQKVHHTANIRAIKKH